MIDIDAVDWYDPPAECTAVLDLYDIGCAAVVQQYDSENTAPGSWRMLYSEDRKSIWHDMLVCLEGEQAGVARLTAERYCMSADEKLTFVRAILEARRATA